MIRIGHMRLTQRGSLMTRDDVLVNRELAYQFFGTRDVQFNEPHNVFLWIGLFYYLHVVEVLTPDPREKWDE